MSIYQGGNASIELMKDGWLDPAFITPTYVSVTSFTVGGDVTEWLKPGRGLRLVFATSGVKICLATSLSYSSDTDKTTINTTGDGLVNETITSAEISLSDLEAIRNEFQDIFTQVAYFPFEENTGITTYDKTGNGNGGILIGGTTWANGKIGKALSFDGVDDYCNCGKNPSLNITDKLSIEAWIYAIETVGHRSTIISKDYSYTDNRGWMMWVDRDGGNNEILFVINDNIAARASFSGYWDKWTHIIGVKDGTEKLKLYINGAEPASYIVQNNGAVPNYTGTGDFLIGNRGDSAGYTFKGLIDEVRIYNRALSANEAMAHYLRS